MPIPWGEIATIGAAAGSFAMQGKQNAKNRRFSEKMADKSWHRSMDLRNWDNEYNTPQSQMERLKQAGINPLLPFLKGGNATGGSSAPTQSTPQAKHVGTMPTGGMTQSITDIYDLKLKKAGTDKIIEETEGLKTANERALVTWLQDKGFINETQAAAAGQKIAEAGLKQIEHSQATGGDAYYRAQSENQIIEDGKDITAGYKKAKIDHTTIKKANKLIDANAENVTANNMARKALKEWLENPKGGWEALKTALMVILTK